MKDTIEGVTKDVARKYGKIAGNKIAEPKLQNKMMRYE